MNETTIDLRDLVLAVLDDLPEDAGVEAFVARLVYFAKIERSARGYLPGSGGTTDDVRQRLGL